MEALLPIVLAALFILIIGGYSFTWMVFMEMRKGNRKLWEEFTEFKDNDIVHIKERLTEMEKARQ